MQDDPLGFFVTLAFALGACVYGAYGVFRRWSYARHMLDTPTSKIRSAAQGYVELTGILKEVSDVPVIAPLTGKACLWWRYRIEEELRTEKKRQWRVVDSGVSDAWLRLDDGTGQCLINPRGAQVSCQTRDVWQGSTRHPQSATAKGWRAVLSFGKRYRYSEERLLVGQPLYAIGDFRTQRAVQDVSQLQRDVIVQWKTDYTGLLQRFDQDRNGQLDEQEWQQVRDAAAEHAQQQAYQAASREPIKVMGRPTERRPFILSDSGESTLARRFYWQAALHGAICLAGALSGAWLFGVQNW